MWTQGHPKGNRGYPVRGRPKSTDRKFNLREIGGPATQSCRGCVHLQVSDRVWLQGQQSRPTDTKVLLPEPSFNVAFFGESQGSEVFPHLGVFQSLLAQNSAWCPCGCFPEAVPLGPSTPTPTTEGWSPQPRSNLRGGRAPKRAGQDPRPGAGAWRS